MSIRKLPPLLVNQIAAGEVIERPASVVKELVENSLDAGATRIDIVVEDGGRQLIRISDDGSGIGRDDLPLAVAPHATSKLSDVDDLAHIDTLGFRGEALASIASVSRMRITTRTRDSNEGWMLEATGDDVTEPAPAGCAPGTVIEVRDLFFNTPARRKFMRAASTEMGYVSEMILRIAMVHPGVAFTLSHGPRKTLDVAATTSRRQRCIELIGAELEDAMLEFEHEDVSLSPSPESPDGSGRRTVIWGVAGLPSIARATSKFQYLCINGRPIRDRNLGHAIKEAYRGLIPPDRQPVAVVFIDTDATAVDVNVHPTKAEVRFRDPSRMHGLVLHALRQRLLASDLTPSATIPSSVAPTIFDAPDTLAPPPPTSPASSALPSPSPASVSAFVDHFRRMDSSQKGFVYQQVKQEMAAASPEGEQPMEDAWAQAERQSTGAASQPPPALRELGVLQVHQSYLVTQDDHGIVIIDQHALHERVMFEELRRRVLSRTLESQRLLMPATMPATARRMDLLETVRPLLERIGIEAEPMGRGSIAIHAFPTLLFDRKVDPIEFVGEVLDRAEEGELDVSNPGAEEAALHEVLDMMSCKAAVKAGDHMAPDELAALLQKREEIERASNCPHGRPTTLRLTLRDLEKQFKRT